MKLLLTGSSGQLGHELQKTAPSTAELFCYNHESLDVCDNTTLTTLLTNLQPDWILHAAAYTAVDGAETAVTQAYAVNRDATRHLAQLSRELGCGLVTISTDYLFDGGQSTPYGINSPPNPLSVYGASKWAGELAVQENPPEKWFILRTAWLYSSHGRNFVKTMLRLLGERPSVRVVADQIGTPTWADGLARAIWRGIDCGLQGLHHWTDAGVASWYDLAVAVQEEALALGLLNRSVPVIPIGSAEYPTPARRPAYSVLDKQETWQALAIHQPDHWRVGLRAMLREIAHV